jgi:hypothetical protein
MHMLMHVLIITAFSCKCIGIYPHQDAWQAYIVSCLTCTNISQLFTSFLLDYESDEKLALQGKEYF